LSSLPCARCLLAAGELILIGPQRALAAAILVPVGLVTLASFALSGGVIGRRTYGAVACVAGVAILVTAAANVARLISVTGP